MAKKIKAQKKLEEELNKVIDQKLNETKEFNAIVLDLVNDLEKNDAQYKTNKKAYEDAINNHYKKLQEYLRDTKGDSKRAYHDKDTNYKKAIDVNAITTLANLNMFKFNDSSFTLMNNNGNVLYINFVINHLNQTNFVSVFILANIIKECFYDRNYTEFTTEELAKYIYNSKAYTTTTGKTTYTKISEEKRLEINKNMYVLSHVVADHVAFNRARVEYKPLFNISSNSINLEKDTGNVRFKLLDGSHFYINFVNNEENSHKIEFTGIRNNNGKGKDKLEELRNFLEHRLTLMKENESVKKYITTEEITNIYKTSSRKGKIETMNIAKSNIDDIAKDIFDFKIRSQIDNTGRRGAIRGIKITFLKNTKNERLKHVA